MLKNVILKLILQEKKQDEWNMTLKTISRDNVNFCLFKYKIY